MDGKPPQPFVAKRFFNIGGEGVVSCTDNAHFLGLEAQRLELGNIYLSEFYKHARTQDAQVSTGTVMTYRYLNFASSILSFQISASVLTSSPKKIRNQVQMVPLRPRHLGFHPESGSLIGHSQIGMLVLFSF